MSDDPVKDRNEQSRSHDLECFGGEAFLTGIIDSLHQHVAVIDEDGTIIAVNHAWKEFARDNDAKSSSAVSEGANYLDVCRGVCDEDNIFAGSALEGIQKVLDGNEKFFTMEYPCSSPTQERWFLMTAVPMHGVKCGAVITHTNITRRKLAEDQLRQNEQHLRDSREEYRALARKLLTAREEAQRRLARELHDSFSQRLALLSMQAAKMEIEQIDHEAFKTGLKRIQGEIEKLSGDVHDIARQLHPQILEDLGLGDALDSFCSSFSKNEGIPVEFRRGDIPADLKLETALNLYRILQEGLRNAAKHARANRIEVDIDLRQGVLHLSVKDDGIGFDVTGVRNKKRMGLISLKERASLIGGTLEISSKAGSGTEVKVTVPLSNA
jgi:signal transduction histidine kinase